MQPGLLVVRLGAMGDVIHALPAAASLKQSFPALQLTWVVDPRWMPLLEANPFIDEVIPLDRRRWPSLVGTWRRLREMRFELAVDFQGLIKSALVASVSRATRIVGYHASKLRERGAALFYSATCNPLGRHVVDMNLELAAAAGATCISKRFPLPEGLAEGELPERFVLASPFAGWPSKEWPLENYVSLAGMLKMPLVLNGHPGSAEKLKGLPGVRTHISSIAGLIDATRRASAVVGVDSGPLHLAAALGKPGVAIFGPTDPARNGPYGGSMRVLRDADAVTSYKRSANTDLSMLRVAPEAVAEALHAIS